jgi:hypothetical protein
MIMSTRSCIARVTGEGKFTGVYHHWDGYPTALGATLYDLYHDHFNCDLDAMLKYLIDAHPAGWSTINGADFNLPAAYDSDRRGDPHGPACFCHGGRQEKAQPVTQDDDMGMEWAYVFDEEKRVMYVLERLYTDNAGEGEEIFSGKKVPNLAGKHMTGMFGFGAEGKQLWADAATVELDNDPPDWKKVSASQAEAA